MLQRSLSTASGASIQALVPWSLYSWPPVFWQAHRRNLPKFTHIATRVTASAAAGALAQGHTVWRGETGEGNAGMAWDWVELRRGIVSMADPTSVLTNLQLLRANGAVMSETESALTLAAFVHRLPWQAEVSKLLDRGGTRLRMAT